MPAECYWCSIDDVAPDNPPLGTCSDCWVFACLEHAERDKNLGKWKCFAGVAKLVTVAAGLDDPDDVDDPPIRTAQELSEPSPASPRRPTACARSGAGARRTSSTLPRAQCRSASNG